MLTSSRTRDRWVNKRGGQSMNTCCKEIRQRKVLAAVASALSKVPISRLAYECVVWLLASVAGINYCKTRHAKPHDQEIRRRNNAQKEEKLARPSTGRHNMYTAAEKTTTISFFKVAYTPVIGSVIVCLDTCIYVCISIQGEREFSVIIQNVSVTVTN